jgi:hypothetical protein
MEEKNKFFLNESIDLEKELGNKNPLKGSIRVSTQVDFFKEIARSKAGGKAPCSSKKATKKKRRSKK